VSEQLVPEQLVPEQRLPEPRLPEQLQRLAALMQLPVQQEPVPRLLGQSLQSAG